MWKWTIWELLQDLFIVLRMYVCLWELLLQVYSRSGQKRASDFLELEF